MQGKSVARLGLGVGLITALAVGAGACGSEQAAATDSSSQGGATAAPAQGGNQTSSSGGATQAANSGGATLGSGGTLSTSSTKGSGGVTSAGGSKASGGATSTTGTKASGGTTSAGGSKATGGSTAAGGKASGGTTSAGTCTPWPAAAGSEPLTATKSVSGTFDGGMKRFTGWGGTQDENQDPLFQLANGATIQNVIIGAPAGDGIHCEGSCTIKNVWWEDVGEDAATLKGSSSSQVMTIDCAGAKSASDKIFQHNGPGTMIIKNFWAETFGKVYRSCGNCTTQYTRHAIFSNITATGGSTIAGVNTNYNDTASFWNVSAGGAKLCQRYTGNDTGAEPVATGSGIDGTYCINLTSAP